MAVSRKGKAEHRHGDVLADIREDLAGGEHPNAVYTAIGAVMSELAKRRRREPAAAALLDAEIAGALAGVAARLWQQKPQRPATYEGGVPQAEDLLAVFTAAYGRAAGNGASHVT